MSQRICPFQRIGCKFRHDEPVNENQDIETIVEHGDFDENFKEVLDEHLADPDTNQKENVDDSDSGSGAYGENDCHLCPSIFTCLDELCEHFETSHEDYYLKTQNLVVF